MSLPRIHNRPSARVLALMLCLPLIAASSLPAVAMCVCEVGPTTGCGCAHGHADGSASGADTPTPGNEPISGTCCAGTTIPQDGSTSSGRTNPDAPVIAASSSCQRQLVERSLPAGEIARTESPLASSHLSQATAIISGSYGVAVALPTPSRVLNGLSPPGGVTGPLYLLNASYLI